MRYLTHSIIVGLMGALMSCSGEEGPQGAAGAAGADGKAGDPGAAGATGAAGAAALTNVKDAPADKCPDGGKMVEAGLDKDGNGTLEASEVTSTSYICNGAGGKPSLVKLSPEPAGANCPLGGTKIETGLDKNANGTLDADEVVAASTAYACNVAPSGTISPSEGINVAIKTGGVSTATTGPITVRFTLKDNRGFPVDIAGKYSKNTVIAPRFALAYFTKDATSGVVAPLTVYTKSASTSAPTVFSPTAYNPTSTGQGKLTENGSGAGDYTYEFPTAATTGGAAAVAYDAAKLGETHVVWIQASRQTDEVYTTNANTFYTANQDYYFIPSGTGTPLKREIVTQANCNKCHDNFKPESTSSAEFHGGGRISALFCNVCHNPARANQAADSAAFVHNIHNGHKIATASRFHGIAATYPQDIRNCGTCHKGAAQGGQFETTITRKVCTSCHASVSFTDSAAVKCTNPPTLGADGIPIACNHQMGVQTDDTGCATCHGVGKTWSVTAKHQPVVPPDPNNIWNKTATVPGTNMRTNPAWVAATGYVPTGAAVITYDVKTVDTVVDTVDTSVKHPRITFKLKKDGTDVVFQTYTAGTTEEMMPNFVGSPNVYFAWAVPQDGVNAPADFNQKAGAYVKNIWNGKATGTSVGTMSAPDSAGYYTITLTALNIPSTATMLTGGLGYEYSLGNANGPSDVASRAPLIQTNVAGYLFNATTNQGGLIVPSPNVVKVSTGYTARRPIVENAKCNNCHGVLGAAPNFHTAQRNDGPTCSFCHTPNQTSSGWSAGSKYFIHAIHAGRKRVNPYVWHATAPGAGYGEIEFPSALNKCTNCHAPNTYDFTASSATASVPNQLFTTVAYSTYSDTSPTYYTFSPYVKLTTTTVTNDYGALPAYSATTKGLTGGAANAVISPVMTACASCHDSPTAIDHMTGNGGHFYEARSTSLTGAKEQCMMCHGPGRVAAIGEVHQR